MKIVQVTAYYPPHLGGQENVVQDLACHLAKGGHQVTVITSAVGGGAAGVTVEGGVRVIRLSAFEFGHAAIMPGFFATLCREIDEHTIVHLHIGQAFTPEITALASMLRHAPFIAELHIDFQPSGPAAALLPFYKKHILGPVLRRADRVVVLNKAMQQRVRSLYNIADAQIMSNGIDEAFFKVQRKRRYLGHGDQLRLLTVGRLTEQKNIGTLLRAIARCKRSVHLDVVGHGEQSAQLHALRDTLELAGKVTLHGKQPRQVVLDFYKDCDVLVMPSLYEAQPLVLLEAMAARIPIIGTDVVGVGEHLQNCGILVSPTEKALHEAIEQFGTTPEQLQTQVEQGFQKANNLRWSVLKHTYTSLYQEVLACK
ncbi:MAG TPA: glycosyltransferase family 4 protein [Candidatus Saccharimonadales bacterium]|nr:glycosyltransferase family 4 protein [Candidatus Saccharimonadales bacterium]